MMHAILKFLFDLKFESAGWKLFETKLGCFIVSPETMRSYVIPLAPFFLNLVFLALLFLGGSESYRMAIWALPFSLLGGIYFFQDTVAYFNDSQRLFMSGGFAKRLTYGKIALEEFRNGNNSFVLSVVASDCDYRLDIWKSDNQESNDAVKNYITEKL